MGKGDKKTKKGKIWRGTYGNSRKRPVRKVGSYTSGISADSTSESKAKKVVAPKKKVARTKRIKTKKAVAAKVKTPTKKSAGEPKNTVKSPTAKKTAKQPTKKKAE